MLVGGEWLFGREIEGERYGPRYGGQRKRKMQLNGSALELEQRREGRTN